MSDFEYTTKLNGAEISVWFDVTWDEGNAIPSFHGVFYECQNITPVLSKEQIAELEMEGEKGFWEYGWESANGY